MTVTALIAALCYLLLILAIVRITRGGGGE